MKKNDNQKTRKFLVFFVFVTLIVAIIAVGAAVFIKKHEVRTANQTGVITKDVALASDVDFAQTVLDSVVVDSSSVQLALVDLDGNGKEDYRVALYNFKTRNDDRSGFRVYNKFGDLKFEDNSSAWSSNPTSWRWVKIGDADSDGDNELFISGTEEGTGGFTHQIILDASRFGLQKLSDDVFGGSVIADGNSNVQKYEDIENGIRLSLPNGWTAGIDEGGNRYVYGQSPYRSVSFEIFTDNESWRRVKDGFAVSMGSDSLVKEESLTVGGFSTVMRLYQRDIGAGSSFQYAKYFVDGGSRWYLIGTSDPNEDITSIINSIEFTK